MDPFSSDDESLLESSIHPRKRPLQENDYLTELEGRILSLERKAASEKLEREVNQQSSVEEMIQRRMEPMEQKLDNLRLQCQDLESKLEWIIGHMDEWGITTPLNSEQDCGSEAIAVGVPSSTDRLQLPVLRSDFILADGAESEDVTEEPTARNVEGVEGDYPNGVWLGDPTNPDLRVKVPITPEDLYELNRTCLDVPDMALTLLDTLFDREIQACSNLSGKGKLKKKPLDPAKIEAIRCHLIYKFNISDQEWNDVKIKLDGKCKTAFQRKRDGLPLTTVRTFKKRSPRTPRKQLPVANQQGGEDKD